LDVERLSWIPIVYFNVIKAIRMIFSDFEFESNSDEPISTAISSSSIQRDVSSLRIRLLPLMALENTLTSELNGGVSIAGGRSGYVRSGWQSLIKPSWSTGVTDSKKPEVTVDNRIREITNLVARTMSSAADDIEALWTHEAIKYCVIHRKIRLDECAA
jgi:hypothetical protein